MDDILQAYLQTCSEHTTALTRQAETAKAVVSQLTALAHVDLLSDLLGED